MASLWGYTRLCSCIGPCTSRLTSDSATKFSSSVLMTSMTPNRSLSQTGTAIQTAPARAEPANSSGMAKAEGT